MARWEPRYDRCRNCDGVGQRIKHTIVRNFVTYGGDDLLKPSGTSRKQIDVRKEMPFHFRT